jgi:hypothetical protein
VRGFAVAGLLALAGCNPGIAPQNQTAPVRNESGPTPTAANRAAPAPANIVETAPEAAPDPAGMSPYRRREYDRGYRDCMTGHFDPERQGESYRIGCMAAEDATQR